MKASVLDYVEFFFDFQNSFIPNYLAQRNPCIPFRLFQGYTPADCFMLRARSLTLDSALPKIWLRFTIFAKLFHSVWFSFLWSFLRKLLRRPLTAQTNPKLSRFGFVLRTAYAFFLTIRQSGFTDGRSPGERKAGADKPEGRQAECFEREVNPRQPTTNPQPVI